MTTTEPADTVPETARLTVDVVLFGEFDDDLWVLMIERGWDPHKDKWALPGGHVDRDEDTEAAAHRELAEETGIKVGSLEFVGAYAQPGRDPRGRYVTFAYAARMPHRIEPTAGDDAASAQWVRVNDLFQSEPGRIAFDHDRIIRNAMEVIEFYN